MKRSRRLLVSAAAFAVAASGVAAQAAPRARVATTPSFTATVLRDGGGEPNVSISPSGRTVLVAGLGRSNPADFFRSTDYGRSFKRLTPSFPDGFGGGDWDMRWLDERTIVAVDLGSGVFVHRSTNAGVSWSSTEIQGEFYDRPWIDHFGRDKVYVVAKSLSGIPYLYSSSDGGVSFGSPPIPILVYGTGLVPAAAGGRSPTPAEAAYGGLSAYVDAVRVHPRTGMVYVLYGLGGENNFSAERPVGVANRVYVAHLENGAFESVPVHMGEAGESFISGFNWLTIDSAGTIYALLNGSLGGHHSAYLSYSKDGGRSWSGLRDVGARGAANVFGSIAAGSPGTLSLLYLRGSTENPAQDQSWWVEMARVTGANTGRPSIYRTRPVRAPVHTQDICFDGIACGLPGFGDNRALLDFIWNAIAPDGTAYGVVASDGPATGGGRPSVVLLRQSGGVRHGRGAPS
ncbi:MAG: hypothetical protein ACRDJM_01245 [Actinomycetota bacterium]